MLLSKLCVCGFLCIPISGKGAIEVDIYLLPFEPRALRLVFRRCCFLCVGIVQVPQKVLRAGTVYQNGKSVPKDHVAHREKEAVRQFKQHAGLSAMKEAIVVVVAVAAVVLCPPSRILSLLELGRCPVEASPGGKPRKTRGRVSPRINFVDRQEADQEVPAPPGRRNPLVLDHSGKGLHHPHLRQEVGKG